MWLVHLESPLKSFPYHLSPVLSKKRWRFAQFIFNRQFIKDGWLHGSRQIHQSPLYLINEVHVYLANTDGSVLDWCELRSSTYNLLSNCIKYMSWGGIFWNNEIYWKKYEILIEKLEMEEWRRKKGRLEDINLTSTISWLTTLSTERLISWPYGVLNIF